MKIGCLFGHHERFVSKIAMTESRPGEIQNHVGGRCASCGQIKVLRSFGWVSTSAPGALRAEKRRVSREKVVARG